MLVPFCARDFDPKRQTSNSTRIKKLMFYGHRLLFPCEIDHQGNALHLWHLKTKAKRVGIIGNVPFLLTGAQEAGSQFNPQTVYVLCS
mmetsp:Transcript_2384/g.4654  ORF Transcript_2384/g.4654 Transcript_2384/m.4654 type:complete len:88 (-) Transcript_2384:1727-1990(-)